jgi:4-amino-4-deoxy-L-arabinose transferase-like glycosyltransferase
LRRRGHARHPDGPLVAILVTAFLLRVWGITFGLPHTFARPDEEATLATALRFFGRHFDPQFYHWPSLFPSLVAAGFVAYFNVGRFRGWFPREYTFLTEAARTAAPLFLIARGVTLLAGTTTVWLVHRVGLQLFDRRRALTAAFFLAVAALHVRDSHFGVPDITATCIAVGSFLWTCRFVASNRVRDLMISAVGAGAAASTKYNVGLIAIPAIMAIVTAADRQSIFTVNQLRLTVAYAVVAVAAFCVGSPYVLADWRAFAQGLGEIGEHLRNGQLVASGPTWGVHFFTTLRYGLGWPVLLAGVVGLALHCLRNRRQGLVLASFPVVYFIVIGAGQLTFARYLIPVVPFLMLGAAYLVCDLGERASRWMAPSHATAMVALLVLLVASPSVVTAIQIDRLLSRTDTRVLATESLARAFPCGAAIHQTGFIYGHLQLPERFRQSEAAVDVLPDIIVVQHSMLEYSRTPKPILEIVATHYRKTTEVLATTDGARPIYDYDDAFFVPLSNFSGVLRPGPDIRVYVRRDYHPRSC